MINRFIFNKLEKEISRPEINILLGPRQVGKTTLLRMLEAEGSKRGLSTAFFDLEQPSVLAEFNLPNSKIIEKLRQAGQLLIIDEFQYLENASRIFKAIYDEHLNIKIICSGSSSLEIHRHLKESLAGRRILFRVFPLQFKEIRNWDGNFQIKDYFCYGGMPGVVFEREAERKEILLSEFLSAFILKDIKALVREENIRSFNHLLYLLAENQGSTISVNSLANEVNMSGNAVGHYLEILEQTFVGTRIYSYSQNLGNELKKSCKFYLYDLGIRNALLKDFSFEDPREDLGILKETAVFLKIQQLLGPKTELRFWRTKDGAEVDFIILHNRQPIPVEVKSKLKRGHIPVGLKNFLVRYPNTRKAVLVGAADSSSCRIKNCEIDFLSLEDFLLNGGKILGVE